MWAFPASFTRAAPMNPRPVVSLGDPRKACRCSPTRIQHYRGRVSGPLLDRIDLHIEVPRVSLDELSGDRDGEPSANVRRRVVAARELQQRRFEKELGIHTNAQMSLRHLITQAQPDGRGRALLKMAGDRMGFSGRAFHRVMRVARTIADLEGVAGVGEKHIAEAIGYRVLDRGGTVT